MRHQTGSSITTVSLGKIIWKRNVDERPRNQKVNDLLVTGKFFKNLLNSDIESRTQWRFHRSALLSFIDTEAVVK